MTEFSIVIPTYNRADCIGRAMRSVLCQTYPHWSVLVIDDGSTDGTNAVVDTFLEDGRISYHRKENGGVGSARNFGIRKRLSMPGGKKDSFFVFLDSDDELVPSALSDMAGSIESFRQARVFLFGSKDQEGQLTYRMEEPERVLSYGEMLSNRYADGEMMGCFHSSVFLGEKRMFPESVNGGECLLLWNLARRERVVGIRKVVRIYHTESGASIVRSPLSRERISNLDTITKMILAEFGDDLQRFNPKAFGMYCLVYARTRALLGNRAESVRHLIRGLSAYPLQVGLTLLYLISLIDYSYGINNFLARCFSR